MKHYQSIILSGLPQSGKTSLAKKLSEIHAWEIYSVGQIFRDDWRKKFPNGERTFEEYWRNTTVEENLKVNKKIREIIEKGSVIADSRFSAIYCQDLPSLMVFITADLGTRALRLLREGYYDNKPVEEIKQILSDRERDESKMCKKLYNVDYKDPRFYHLTLNSGMLSLEEEVSLIAELI